METTNSEDKPLLGLDPKRLIFRIRCFRISITSAILYQQLGQSLSKCVHAFFDAIAFNSINKQEFRLVIIL